VRGAEVAGVEDGRRPRHRHVGDDDGVRGERQYRRGGAGRAGVDLHDAVGRRRAPGRGVEQQRAQVAARRDDRPADDRPAQVRGPPAT
jgi:hypothetical protein